MKALKHPLRFLVAVLMLLFVLTALFLYMVPPSINQSVLLEAHGTVIRVDLAITSLEKTRGLSGRGGLGKNEGMLFLFDSLDRHAMWMKGMTFPIDILWIKNGKVADIEYSAEAEPGVPDEFLTRYSPDISAELVLELPAGFAKRHEISIGDEVYLLSGALPATHRALLKEKGE